MRLLSLVVLLAALVVVGCKGETKITTPTNTVPAPSSKDIVGGGTGAPGK